MKTIKEKKKLIIGIVIAVVLVIAIICIAVLTNKKTNEKVKTPIKSETVVFTDKDGKPLNKKQKDKAKEKQAKKDEAAKKAEEKKKAKAWGDVEIVEEGTKSKKDKVKLYKRNKKGEIVTNKKGEKVTRKAKYAGEDEGWSPIVNPDDLKKNK
ncbi:MAG: hypothetical protein K6E58_00385 [Eubacterium sp.]|nr:hypothetical protein [Eubacterium sp.]